MLQGAIIGGVVGFIVAFVMLKKRSGAGRRVYQALESGGAPAARAVLDPWIAPINGPIKLSKLLDTIERVAALAIIGDLDALRAELARAEGKLSAVVQVQAMGLVALVTEAEDPAQWAAELEQVAQRVEAEGGAMLKLVKRNTRWMADVARELSGEGAVSYEHKQALAKYAGQMGPFSKPLLFKFLAKATEASGGNPDPFTARYKAALPRP